MNITKRETSIILYFALAAGLFLQTACISYRKRPTHLYKHVIQSGRTFDVGIVPGIPFDGKKWDTVMKGRVLWAHHLYETGIVRNFIFSGSAVYTPYTEAIVMGLYVQALGIPVANILYDTSAEHSTENIFYSYRVARQHGFKTIALVTDPFQSSLTKRFTRRRFATEIYHLPFMVDTLRKLNHIDPVIDPSAAYVKNFKSIKEREGFFKRFRGTLGAYIPWEGKKRKAGPL